jgi:AraC family transcriptional regulator, regulatory protein of adaptative response / methylated-DNA-[protein]-cysteine methyltransferase
MTSLFQDQSRATFAQAGPIDRDPRWTAVMARDPAFDGKFVYAVKTTGVYCRPTCPSRRAKPENVTFYETCENAERAGFRACKRCRPSQAPAVQHNAAVIAAACRTIERVHGGVTLQRLADEAGMSRYHFHRLFRSVTGVTPKAYADARRAMRVRQKLADRSASVTAAIYQAGFNSNGRFYARSDSMLGMTPTAFRSGGAETVIKYATGQCSLGSVLVALSVKGVCAILLGDDPAKLIADLRSSFPRAELVGGNAEFDQWVATVIAFVEAPPLGLDLPLDIRGTAFQQRVWRVLQAIPAGATASYAEIARRIGAASAVRAVARACSANTLAVVIPCHRVVRSNGALSGYRWGIARKRALLAKEQK